MKQNRSNKRKTTSQCCTWGLAVFLTDKPEAKTAHTRVRQHVSVSSEVYMFFSQQSLNQQQLKQEFDSILVSHMRLAVFLTAKPEQWTIHAHSVWNRNRTHNIGLECTDWKGWNKTMAASLCSCCFRPATAPSSSIILRRLLKCFEHLD